MPSECTNILEFNQYQKSDDTPFLVEKIVGCEIILKNHQQQKQVNIFCQSGFSMPKILSFKYMENKHDVYRGKDFLISKEARNEDN